ncbi:MAG: hypothetical protein LQ343_002533 [Gyalolechia ehrenbergii]|nr:MAG: hypothetical protein LQ343_002533 [Gyalolechia ehrenbergii]
MQHFVMSKKRSQRSRRQPDTGNKSPTSTSAGLNCVESGSNVASQAPGVKKSIRPRRTTPPAIQVDHPQISLGNSSACSHQPPIHAQPPEMMMIGVALGSPGKSPVPPLPSEGTSIASHPSNRVSPDWSDKDALRTNRSRWKAFGDLFSKRAETGQSPLAPSLYQLRQPKTSPPSHEVQRKLRRPQPSFAQSKLQDIKVASVGDSCSRNWIGPEQLPSPQKSKDPSYRRKASLRRHNFERKQVKDSKKYEWLEATRVRSHPKGDSIPPEDKTQSKSFSSEASQGASLLQVEIPSLELERYSVMFSSLLHPSQQSSSSRQPSPKRQPSLLARRQANLQELQPRSKTDFEPPWIHGELSSGNRAASANKSPSFSLFPASPTAGGRKNHGVAHERSPLQRSATAPSPSKAKFDFSSTGDQQDQVIVIVHTPTEQSKPRQRSTSEELISRVPSQKTTSSEETFTTARASPAPSIEFSSLPVHGRNGSPQRTLEAEKPLDDVFPKAAEISIARQISVSRRQRQLLVPAVPRVAPQPVQPKIVDVHQENRLRKSHHLVLEDA